MKETDDDETFVTCENCGDEHVPVDDIIEDVDVADGGTEQWCEPCLDHSQSCEGCGGRIPAGDEAYDLDDYSGEVVCRRCYIHDFTYCDDCERLFHNDDISRHNGRDECESCREYRLENEYDENDEREATYCHVCRSHHLHIDALTEARLCDCRAVAVILQGGIIIPATPSLLILTGYTVTDDFGNEVERERVKATVTPGRFVTELPELSLLADYLPSAA